MVPASLTAAFDLSGRRAVVTGAGSGIGRAAAIVLGQAGASVLALDIDGAGLAETKALASRTSDAASGTAFAAAAVVDVSDFAAVENALATDRFDVVVNAAGIMAPDSLAATDGAQWDRVLAVNLTGCFNVLKCAVPHMSGPASVIQISSMMGHRGLAFPAYTATKGAVLALTRQLADELGPRGIRVNSVSPGMILTGMTRDHLAHAEHRDQITERTPLRRVGAAEDIGYAVLYLASDLSAFVTGTDILVDGGLTSVINL
ncbi:SDR family oxidoreductase [Catenulispora sp. NF23]|uniref:SDR family NAD(P)-dependent oxidoreductase n=1 Tax=Catenulispora pinistramenti TaxID=2705254 RepID=UPI001BA9FF71|nr:SDR family NAD(P)-dependent oxidoreductase [Catenulispora pinistramenti]MBS2536220.1 SDR family oxidoreductase [Catenulispora pinistramenti]